jgi:hypothetical protein
MMLAVSSRLLVFLPLVAIMAATPACQSSRAFAAESDADSPGFAVVELFTSEGCSNCPSADRAFAEIVARSSLASRVYPLAFQVDYWNSLGWTDRFSTELATARQRTYAASLGTTSVYTPQMIVGGVDAFVGSDQGRANAAIARAMAERRVTRVTLAADGSEGAAEDVRFHVEPVPEGAEMHIALVERGLTTRVLAGENQGKVLDHENVVRAFVSVPIRGADGSATLTVPLGVVRDRAEIIGFVQAGLAGAGRGMPVLAGARTPIR